MESKPSATHLQHTQSVYTVLLPVKLQLESFRELSSTNYIRIWCILCRKIHLFVLVTPSLPLSHCLACSLTQHPLIYTLTNPPTYLPTHRHTHSFTHSLTHSPTHSLTHSCTHSSTPIHSLTHTHPLTHPQNYFSESCECACVIFASIPEFWSLYSETEINQKGKEWLRLLNEIIGDFDDVI